MKTSFHNSANFKLLKPSDHYMYRQFNPLNNKRRPLYLKTQLVAQ